MDMACWRQRDGFVLRLFGSERLLSDEEWRCLRMLMEAIDCGKTEAYGEGYTGLLELAELEKSAPDKIDLAALGLVKRKAPIDRRF